MSTQPAASPSRVPLIGQVLSGRYRILAKLGEGAMAAVYLAEHTGVGKTIVLKVLLPDLAMQPAFVEGFLREAHIAAEIHDDNVIDIFYSGRSPEGYVFLAMEHVDGPTLFTLLGEQGPLPWARAKPILVQIAGALAAAHAHGVVHRDVKPENVLVGRRQGPQNGTEEPVVEYIKVVDFGIANAHGDASATGADSVAGTPEFMSPEQAQGRAPDARDDVYAFGCLMYQVLTGDVPFRDDDMARLLLMHLRDPVQPPRQRRPDLEIPGGAQDIVMRALAKARADRWQDMGEVGRQLAAVEGMPAQTEEVPAPRVDAVALSPSLEPRSRASEAPKPALPNLRLPKDETRSTAPLFVGAGVVLAAVAFAFLRYMLLHAPGRLEIVTAPPEAEIYVDGQKMTDRSPMFLDASPGSYDVVVRSPGYETLTTVLVITPRGNERIPLNLTPLPPQSEAAAPRHAAASAEPRRKKPAAPPPVNGVTFIDFKKTAAEQHAR
ncbi:MAG: serine/threonine protein kinase [Myxococcales bacterium]|jgi:serine/threonine protein kinase|nr:serine/threonine protein kinase [Myxococcales bacterium]